MIDVFDAYARYYDLLYRDKDYAAEAAYVASLIRGFAPNASEILDLGCGSGAHAVELAQLGFRVHGVDRSEEMIDRARARLSQQPPDIAGRVSLEVGDLRKTRTGDKYDAVVSLFHVMSYQIDNDDLANAFETAASHLEPGGVFLYDFWYGPAVLTEQPEVRVKRLTDDRIGVTRIAEPVLRTDRNLVDVNYTLFIEELDSGAVQQIEETHSMRYLFLNELRLLSEDGFHHGVTHEWMRHDDIRSDSWSGCQVVIRT